MVPSSKQKTKQLPTISNMITYISVFCGLYSDLEKILFGYLQLEVKNLYVILLGITLECPCLPEQLLQKYKAQRHAVCLKDTLSIEDEKYSRHTDVFVCSAPQSH